MTIVHSFAGMDAIPGGMGTVSSEPTLMRGLLEGVPDPAAVLGLDLTYQAFNRAYAEILGAAFGSSVGLGSPIGVALERAVDSEGRTVRDALAQARAGTSVDHHFRGIRSHLHPLRGQDGSVLGVLHLLQPAPASPHDTLRPQASPGPPWLRLRETLRLAGGAAKGTELPRIRVFTWDAALGDLKWSGSLQDFAALVGHLPAPTEPTERMHPEDSRRLVKRISDWQREGRTDVSFDFRVICPDGTERCLDAWARLVPASAGEPARLVGINVDVTETLKTERHLEESRAAYERLFNLTLDGIVVLALSPGGPARTVRTNLALGHLCGRPASSLPGTAFADLLPERERAGFEQQLRNLTPTVSAPYRGFHVIIPPEYRRLGCLPADQFVPQLLQHLDEPYYVALLSAAELHGAAHQRPQAFQVMVKTNRRAISCGEVRVQFIARKDLDTIPVVERKTPRGLLRIASPEATALELVGYADQSGGLDNVASVISELADTINRDRLLTECERSPIAWVQRLGFLLDLTGHRDLADGLVVRVAVRATEFAPLVRSRPRTGATRDGRWKLAVNVTVEPDL